MAGPGEDVAAVKRAMRRTALAARRSRTPEDRIAAGAAVARHGVAQWRGSRRVAAHLDFGTEPPMRPLLDALAAGDTEIVIPVIDGDELDWVRYLPGGEVQRNSLGIAEPTGTRLGAAVLDSVDVVLVPALAVDPAGHRLGRGRGFYDRALRRVSVPAVAIGYDDELVPAVPAEPHDRPVQAMLRPAGYVPFLLPTEPVPDPV